MPEKSNQRRRVGLAVISLALLVLLIFEFFFFGKSYECREYYRPDKTIAVNNKTINLELADDEAKRDLGLSGRKCIDEESGMLFSFNDLAPYCFWMKDMNFAIDILWLDANKTIVDTAINAQPQSYPKSFCPSAAAKYALEIKAGQSARLGLKTGDQIQF